MAMSHEVAFRGFSVHNAADGSVVYLAVSRITRRDQLKTMFSLRLLSGHWKVILWTWRRTTVNQCRRLKSASLIVAARHAR